MDTQKHSKTEIAWENANIWWRYHWLPRQMTSEKRE